MSEKKLNRFERAKKEIAEIEASGRIKDQAAWKEYKESITGVQFIKDSYYRTADDKIISLHQMIGHIRHKIGEDGLKLSKEEQDEIVKRKKKLLAETNRIFLLRRVALGERIGRPKKHDGYVLENKAIELIELFGKLYDLKSVCDIVNKEWKIECTIQMLLDFRLNHKKEINLKEEDYKRSYSSLRMTYKRSRIEDLSWLFTRHKEIYKHSKNANDAKVLLSTLEQIRKETEGDRLTIDGNIEMNIEHSVQVHLKKEVYSSINIKEVILGRIAARTNVPVSELIEQLHKSYYSAMETEKYEYDNSVLYPSEINYDFEAILAQSVQQMELKKTEKQNTGNVTVKGELMDLLGQKLGRVNEARNNTHFEYLKDEGDDY